MYPETLITGGVVGLLILGVIVLVLSGSVLVVLIEGGDNFWGTIFSIALGVAGALIITASTNIMDNTYKSLIEEPDCAYYYIGAEYFTTKPSATEGIFDHYFIDENGELWSFENDCPSYDTDSVYLLCMDDMGTPNDIHDDEVMVVWSTK